MVKSAKILQSIPCQSSPSLVTKQDPPYPDKKNHKMTNMLHLAQVKKNLSSGSLELQLLARQKSDLAWVLENSKSVPLDEENLSEGLLVLVECSDNHQIISIKNSKDWVVSLVKNYLTYENITPEFVKKEQEKLEKWRQEIASFSQDLTRRHLELETRREQLQELEKNLKQEKEDIERHREQLQELEKNLKQEKEDLERHREQLKLEEKKL